MTLYHVLTELVQRALEGEPIMCLAIPARLVEYIDDERMYGKVELGGVQRRINTSLLVGEDATEPGEYVLVHVGFALEPRQRDRSCGDAAHPRGDGTRVHRRGRTRSGSGRRWRRSSVGANYRESNGGPPA